MELTKDRFKKFVEDIVGVRHYQEELLKGFSVLTTYSLYEMYCRIPTPEHGFYCMQQVTSVPGCSIINKLFSAISENTIPEHREYPIDDFIKRLLNQKNEHYLSPLNYRSTLTDDFIFGHPLSLYLENSIIFSRIIYELEGYYVPPFHIEVSEGGNYQELPIGLLMGYLWDSYQKGLDENGIYHPNLILTSDRLEVEGEFPFDMILLFSEFMPNVSPYDKNDQILRIRRI